ncbi:MAG: hypothetical protein AB7K71_38115 [Polyangiaceae bacterium]
MRRAEDLVETLTEAIVYMTGNLARWSGAEVDEKHAAWQLDQVRAAFEQLNPTERRAKSQSDVNASGATAWLAARAGPPPRDP